MGNETKSNTSKENLREFKYRVGYVISETPKYRSLVGTNEEFDEVPVITNEAGDQETVPKPEGQVPPAPSNDQPISGGAESPVPSFDEPPAGGEQPPADVVPPPEGEVPPVDGELPPEGEVPMDAPIGDPMAAPEQPDTQVDEIQNEIIRHNIEAMKSIHDELANMSDNFNSMNAKMDALNADVEEVREPTNGEKLMNQSNVSYPYYFNLNDFWQDNWFDKQMGSANQSLNSSPENSTNEVERGIRKLPDGTFVADFDDLPQKSKIDVQDSFNDI